MGCAYVLVAVGFTVVFGVMNIINFAHGHIAMAAMFQALRSTVIWDSIPTLRRSACFPPSSLSVVCFTAW